MNEIIKQATSEIVPVILAVIGSILSLIVSIYVPAILKKLNKKLGIEVDIVQDQQFENVAVDAVEAVENIAAGSKRGKPSGPEKKASAVMMVSNELIKKHITKSLPQIEDKIEAALLKSEYKLLKWIKKI